MNIWKSIVKSNEKDTTLIKAEMLDVAGIDAEAIVNKAMDNIDEMFS